MGAKQLFRQRWSKQWHLFSRYLKYVFNDHAVIAFLFFAIGLMLAYQQLLATMPVNRWTRLALGLGLLLTLMLFKKPATFIKSADPVLFLGDDNRLRQLWKHSVHYSMVVNGVIQAGMLLIMWPLMQRLLTDDLWELFFVSLSLIGVKALLTYISARQTSRFIEAPNTPLMNWRQIAQVEAERHAAILQFFNLFIDVPGTRARVKSRPWLQPIVNAWPKQTPYLKLLLRTFMRRDPYFSLWVRMTVFGGLVAWFTTGWLQTGLWALLLYLFVIQFAPIVGSYQQLVFDHLWPITLEQRQNALRGLLAPLVGMQVVLWGTLAGLRQGMALNLGISLILLVFVAGYLVFLYTDRITAKMFKRRTTHAFTQ